MIAVNDALMLDALIYRLLKVYWGKQIQREGASVNQHRLVFAMQSFKCTRSVDRHRYSRHSYHHCLWSDLTIAQRAGVTAEWRGLVSERLGFWRSLDRAFAKF